MNIFAKGAKLTEEAFIDAVYEFCRTIDALEYDYVIPQEDALGFYNEKKVAYKNGLSYLNKKQTNALKEAMKAEDDKLC